MKLKLILASLTVSVSVADSQAAGPLRRLFCGRRCSTGCGQSAQVQPAPNYTSVPMSQAMPAVQPVSYQQPIAVQPATVQPVFTGTLPTFLRTTTSKCVNGVCGK